MLRSKYMMLVLFAFFSGLFSVLSPCIFPILPVLFTSLDSQKTSRPWAIAFGFAGSFFLLTLGISFIFNWVGLDYQVIKKIGAVILILLGLAGLLPESWNQFLPHWQPAQSFLTKEGLMGGLLVGMSLG
ncbi:MAG TPA: hypothetical protein ENN77_01330, partial [Candidatus Wirthbacteria bacterium]|nr:hypothetical protein [Candidatus Wirthbacteria bacterium]